MSSNILKINSPATQNYGTISSGDVTKTYTIPAMDVDSITPFRAEAAVKPNTDSSATVIVKAPSGGQYVTEEGVVVSGGGIVGEISQHSYNYTISAIVSGLLIRIS